MHHALARSIIRHEIFKASLGQLRAHIDKAEKGSLIRCCGLTGSGKSELAVLVARHFAGAPAVWQSGKVPAVFLRATKEDRGRFSPKEFAASAFSAIRTPDLRWAFESERAGLPDEMAAKLAAGLKEGFWRELKHSTNEGVLRRSFQEQAVERGALLWIFEDSHNMCAKTRNVRPADFLQPWMAAVEKAGAIGLFLGTSAMWELWDGEGEISRRCSSIYVPRYKSTTKPERKAFLAVIRILAERYQWDQCDPIRQGELIYLVSLGVFGQIKKFFDDAAARAHGQGRSSIRIDDLLSCVPNEQELRRRKELAAHFDSLAEPASLKTARTLHAELLLGR